MSYSDVVLADSPSGYWKCDDAVEYGVIADSSGNGHDMTLSGGATLGAEGLLNEDEASGSTSLLLDGVDGIAVLNGWPSGITDWPVTLETWVEVQGDSGYGAIWLGDHNEGDRSFRLQANSSNFAAAARFDSGSAAASVATATGNRVVHVVGVFVSDTERHIYLNGNLGATSTDSRDFPSTATPRTAIGARYSETPDSFLEGRIGHVAIYSSALSPQRIRAHYLAGQNATLADRITELGPVSYYKLDETTGTTAADSSGNDNHGTISGGVTLGADPLAWSDDTSRAISLDGVDGWVQVPEGILDGAPAVSIPILFRLPALPASGNAHLVNLVIGSTAAGASVYVTSSGALTAGGRSREADSWQGVTTSSGVIKAGRQYIALAVLNYVDDEITLYLDGQPVAYGSVSFGLTYWQQIATSCESSIGVNRNPAVLNYLEMMIDEASIFDNALTAADAFALAERVVQETYVESVLQHQPPSYYRLAEQAGTDAVDSGEAGQDGIYEGGFALAQPGLSTDAGALAADFDGSSGYVDLGNIGGAFDGRAGLTLIASFRLGALPSTNPVAAMITTHAAGNASTALIAHPDGSLQLFSRSAAGDPGVSVMAAAGTVEAGAVYHVAGSLDFAGDMATLYVNGAQVGSEAAGPGWSSSSYVHSAPPANKPCQISGQVDLARFLGSTMSDVAWVTGALTPAQISALHYRGTTAAVPPLSLDGTAMKSGAPVARLIRAHLQSDGSLIGETTSSAADGSWSIPIDTEEPMYVVAHGEGEESDLVAGDLFEA